MLEIERVHDRAKVFQCFKLYILSFKAICGGLATSKWTQAEFVTSKEELTAILINIVRSSS